MRAEEIARTLQARQCADGWIARCPAHEDRDPSLSIREGTGGRILVHCFGGCSLETICAALKIRVGDLFSVPREIEGKPAIVREAERQIAGLRGRLTPRERVLPVTVVYCERENLREGIARALALTVEGEIVQAVLRDFR